MRKKLANTPNMAVLVPTSYGSTMKRRKAPARMDYAWTPLKLPRTGEHCPSSGWWIAAGADSSSPKFIGEGSLMPPHDGHPVPWIPTGYTSPELP